MPELDRALLLLLCEPLVDRNRDASAVATLTKSKSKRNRTSGPGAGGMSGGYGASDGGWGQQQSQPWQPPYPSGHGHAHAHGHAWDRPLEQGYRDPYDSRSSYGAPPPPPPPPAPGAGPEPQYVHPDEFRAPPEVATDVNAFSRFFSYHLGTLSFNSKPVITNLTLFAHQHLLRMSGAVSQCLDEHLQRCAPANKLPALYLLDSISKNIGPPYINLFCRFIERRFLEAYQVVDPATKTKMEELLGTWRTGGADGGELFRGPDEGRVGRVQRGIESTLFGTGGRGGGIGGGGRSIRENESYNSGMQQLPAPSTHGERSGVLFDVRRLLQLRIEQARIHPEDAVNASQIIALQKLESLVLDTQLTSDQVFQIRGQLAALTPREPKTESPAPESAMSVPTSSHFPYDDLATGAPASSSAAPLHPPSASAAAATAPSVAGIDLNLLAQLQGMGDFSHLLAMAGPAVKVEPKREPTPQQDFKSFVPAADKLTKEYEDAIVDLNVLLTNADILRPRPEGSSFLYGRFGLQCKQCGLRFFDSRAGKKQMDAHLDWHFTHKRRIREGAARPQGRSWLSLEEDWLLSDTVDVSYDNAEASTSAVKTDPGVVDRAQLLQRKVVAPPDSGDVACPVCKERFKSQWSEEDEEWVFKNAVEVDDVIYHATCHAEAATSKLSARLRLDESNRASRESTPKVGVGNGSGPENGHSDSKKRRNEWDELELLGDYNNLKRPKAEQLD